MSNLYYTDEKNAQIVIALLKAHGIKKVVASPGATNLAFLGSIQRDAWFEIYSADDERHGGYLACGMAAESGEAVVLSCTGATAGRNYLPALTEAFYRKLPILAITSSQIISHEGQLISQFTDRRVLPNDTARISVQIPPVYTAEQAKDCAVMVNKAILELWRYDGGPAHINLETDYTGSFNTRELPKVKKISRHYIDSSDWPGLDGRLKVAIWIGAHKEFSEREKKAIENFVKCRDCVVLCDATSNYHGVNQVASSLVASQRGLHLNPNYSALNPDLLIHIGEVSNDYATQGYLKNLSPVSWRVNRDGEIRDRFGSLEHVFEMPESVFFERYTDDRVRENRIFKAWVAVDEKLRGQWPEIPFSNLWIAQMLLPKIPKEAEFHFGLSSSLQMWNTQLQLSEVPTISNVGVCGIDGIMSAAIGASLASPKKMIFCVLGDLSFFYDMNAIGNRHIKNNLRILLINNGCGGMFHAPTITTSIFGIQVDDFTAAGGHFGNKSRDVVRHYASDLGFDYLHASSKEEFLEAMGDFVSHEGAKSKIFECFTDAEDDAMGFAIKESLDAYNGSSDAGIIENVKRVIPLRFKNAIKELVK